jgi:hypothetical protein
MAGKLPQKFSELDQWSTWAFATEGERYAKRANSGMDDLIAFHSALQPHMEEIIQYLETFPWGTTLSEEDERLYHLGLSYMEAAVPIDLGWKQPVAVDSFPVERLTLPVRT